MRKGAGAGADERVRMLCLALAIMSARNWMICIKNEEKHKEATCLSEFVV